MEIYGYPAEVFPPTDFHTATLIQDRLCIIGSLGYQNARRPAETPIYAVDLSGYVISKVQASGEAPGWIHEHAAELESDGVITIRGGKLLREQNGKQVLRRNFDAYSLDVGSGRWRRLTDGRWHQFRIRQKGEKLFVGQKRPAVEGILPEGAEALGPWSVNSDFTGIKFAGVEIGVLVRINAIEVVVGDDLPEAEIVRIVDQIRAKAEVAIHKPCVLQKV